MQPTIAIQGHNGMYDFYVDITIKLIQICHLGSYIIISPKYHHYLRSRGCSSSLLVQWQLIVVLGKISLGSLEIVNPPAILYSTGMYPYHTVSLLCEHFLCLSFWEKKEERKRRKERKKKNWKKPSSGHQSNSKISNLIEENQKGNLIIPIRKHPEIFVYPFEFLLFCMRLQDSHDVTTLH